MSFQHSDPCELGLKSTPELRPLLPKSGGGGLHDGRQTAKNRGREYPKTCGERNVNK